MSKVRVIREAKVYNPIEIILETEEEFVNVLKTFNEGGNEVYVLWKQMDEVAAKEGIDLKEGGDKA